MSQGQKRVIDQDPDYESIPVEAQQKRLKLHEQDAKDAAVKKIEQIVRNQFCDEISTREAELDLINKRIYQAQIMLERLRVGIITKYYATGGQTAAESSVASTRGGWEDSQQALASVHPTVRKFLGKGLPAHLQTANKSDEGHHHNQAELRSSLTLVTEDAAKGDTGVASKFATENSAQHPGKESGKQTSTTRIVRGPRCKEKVRVIVGNVSKYIPLDRRDDGGRDQATHKWLAYVRTAPEEPYTIGELVRHVRFFLHPSYRPHDLVEITEPPFQVQRKGWGEFPLRVQLHFHDRWTKHVDIIHQLKLDKTYTGLQTLGSETLVDLWLPASALRSENSSTAANDFSVFNGSMDKTTAVPDGKAVESTSASGNETIAAGKTESRSSSISMGDCEDPLPGDTTSQHSEEACTVIESASTVSSALAAEQPSSLTRPIKTEPEVSTVSADTESSTAHPVEVDATQPPQAKCSASKQAVTEVLQIPSPTILAGVNTVGADPESSTAQPVVVDTSQAPQAKCSASKPAVTAVLQMPSSIVLPGTALSLVNVAPKPVPPKASVAVNSNGVNPPTYVQCTDALGRVLLIPATSLLSASNSPAQQAPQQASQPSSLLQPNSASVVKTAISGTNASISSSLSLSVPKPLSFVLAGASSCTPSASAVNITTAEATAGVSTMKQDTAMGVIHEKVASTSSKIQVNAATVAVTPSSIAHVVNAAGTNILSNVTILPLPKASITSPGPRVQKIGPALKLVRPTLPLSAASVNRTAVPAGALCAAFPPTAVGTSGAGLVSVSSSVASVVPMSPIIKGGAKPSVSNRTNLLSIMCNKLAATSVNTSATIVPDALQQLVAIAPAADKAGPLSVACSKPAPERTKAVMLQATPSVMPSTSKVKSAPNSSAYTLVMIPGTGSGQSQVVLVPTASVKPTVPTPTVVQEKQSPQPSASPESQGVPKVVYPAASSLAQLEKVDPVKELQDKLYAIRFEGFKDVREALFAVLAHFPLVGVKECEKLSCFPYAATDGSTFFSWPLPKRRASEWMRACDVRRTLQLLIERQQPSFLSHLPSRRAIVLLCRRFGFTPLHPDIDGEIEGAEEGSKAPDTGTHNSYSEPSELVSQLASAACAMESVHDGAGNVEEEVDVVGHDGAEVDSALRSTATSLPKQNSGKDTILHCDSSPEKCLPRKAKVHLPLSPKAVFVREAASEVGVHLSSCELEPRIDIPVVEEMIVSACKNFATQLMRSAVNMAFKRVGNERIPSVVTLDDTYHGILELKECSFLTNENLGIESTREGGADNTHL